MEYDEMVKVGLENNAYLKVILKGGIEVSTDGKVGVVSVILVTQDAKLAKNKLKELNMQKKATDYYMVYSIPVDENLLNLKHYPSIAITREDLLE